MRIVTSAAILLGLGLLVLPNAGLARSHMGTGPNSSSLEAVQRERRDKIIKCSRLHPSFDSGTMTYAGPGGKRIACP